MHIQELYTFINKPLLIFIIWSSSPVPLIVSAQYLSPNYRPNLSIKANPLYLGIALAVSTVAVLSIFIILKFCIKPRPDRPRLQLDDGLDESSSFPSTGLDPTVLETFPVFNYHHDQVMGLMECSVCLSQFEEDDLLRLLPQCKHVFHVSCLDPWLKDHITCPFCRMSLVKEYSELTQLNAVRVEEVGSGMGEEVNDEVEGWDIEEGWFGNGKIRRWKSTGDLVECICVERWPCNEIIKFKRNSSCL